jgi:hypothetical protein
LVDVLRSEIPTITGSFQVAQCLAQFSVSILDGFVKSPSVPLGAGLHCILRRCGVPVSTPHSSGLARLASGAFYIAIQIFTFYEPIILKLKRLFQISS